MTVILFGGAAFMTGQAIAETWRPGWQIVPYGLLLGLANAVPDFALFAGPCRSAGADYSIIRGADRASRSSPSA